MAKIIPSLQAVPPPKCGWWMGQCCNCIDTTWLWHSGFAILGLNRWWIDGMSLSCLQTITFQRCSMDCQISERDLRDSFTKQKRARYSNDVQVHSDSGGHSACIKQWQFHRGRRCLLVFACNHTWNLRPGKSLVVNHKVIPSCAISSEHSCDFGQSIPATVCKQLYIQLQKSAGFLPHFTHFCYAIEAL